MTSFSTDKQRKKMFWTNRNLFSFSTVSTEEKIVKTSEEFVIDYEITYLSLIAGNKRDTRLNASFPEWQSFSIKLTLASQLPSQSAPAILVLKTRVGL